MVPGPWPLDPWPLGPWSLGPWPLAPGPSPSRCAAFSIPAPLGHRLAPSHPRTTALQAQRCGIESYRPQWTSFKEPDPTNEQFETMVQGVLHVADLKFWDLERVYVWAECVDRS